MQIPWRRRCRQFSKRRGGLSSFDPPRGDEQTGPVFVVKVADLHHGTLVCSRVYELSIPDVHACVADLLYGRSEIKHVTRRQTGLLHGLEAVPVRLRAGITR